MRRPRVAWLRGASVGANYHRSREAAERVVADIAALGASAVAVQADVGDGEQVEAMVDEVERRLGPIDTLVANAIAHRAAVFGAFAESTWDDFQDVVIGEIAAVYFPARAVVPRLISRGGGVIIAVSSVVARYLGAGAAAHAAGGGGGVGPRVGR